MTQATPDTARDTRPTVAGHPLPWKVERGKYEDNIYDADGEHVMPVAQMQDLDPLVEAANRMAALEAALIEVVQLQVKATYDDEGGVHWQAPGNIMAILDRLGLAHRVWGNQGEAEQVTA